MKVILVILLLLLNVFVNGQINNNEFKVNEYTNVDSCDDGSVFPHVKIYAGLNNTLCIDPPCEVVPGRDVTMDVFFVAPKYLENIKPRIIATAVGANLDYPLFQDDACVGIVNTYCPIVKDEKVQYSYTIHLLDIFPEVGVTLRITIVNKDDNLNITCFDLAIQVVKY